MRHTKESRRGSNISSLKLGICQEFNNLQCGEKSVQFRIVREGRGGEGRRRRRGGGMVRDGQLFQRCNSLRVTGMGKYTISMVPYSGRGPRSAVGKAWRIGREIDR